MVRDTDGIHSMMPKWALVVSSRKLYRREAAGAQTCDEARRTVRSRSLRYLVAMMRSQPPVALNQQVFLMHGEMVRTASKQAISQINATLEWLLTSIAAVRKQRHNLARSGNFTTNQLQNT